MFPVLVLGASTDPSRYSHKALNLLKASGYATIPVNPYHDQIDGLPCLPSLSAVSSPVDTVTVYLNPGHSSALSTDLLALHPRRVIFNPGAENPALATALSAAGIDVIEACTLVMLRTGQF